MRNPEVFRPENPKYKKIEDLPKERQKEFKETGEGFVRKEAAEKYKKANLLAKIAKILRRKKIKNPEDLLHIETKKYDEERERLLMEIKSIGCFPGYSPLKWASEEFCNDKGVVLEAVKQNGFALKYASENLRNNREITLEAVKKIGHHALAFVSNELRNNRDFILEIIKQNGLALQYTSEELRNDREVVLAAVKQNGFALQYAPEELRNDREVVSVAESQSPGAIRYASDKIKSELGL